MYTGLTDNMKKPLEKGREYHVFRPFLFDQHLAKWYTIARLWIYSAQNICKSYFVKSAPKKDQ